LSERRYSDDEVREIFDRASRHDAQEGVGGRPSATGLTLREIQDIGTEAGLSPDAIARAATGLSGPTSPGQVQRIPYLGFPLGLSQSVPLGRRVSESEWGWLLMRLRETFRARGRTEESGPIREWWNGNLRISLEPTEEGDVLHMTTRKGGVQEGTVVGVGLLAFSAVMTVLVALKGQLITDPEKLAIAAMFALGGVGTLLANTLRLPPWFRTRRAQFEALARAMLARGGEDEAGDASREGELLSPATESSGAGDLS